MRVTNLQQETSMLNWFPKIKDYAIVPPTEILPVKDNVITEARVSNGSSTLLCIVDDWQWDIPTKHKAMTG
jgi:hypothetical protein